MLAVDQFEEVFTACSNAAERTAFLDAITEAAGSPTAPSRSSSRCERTSTDDAQSTEHWHRCSPPAILVGPMDADELMAIELPAQRAEPDPRSTHGCSRVGHRGPAGACRSIDGPPRAVDPPSRPDPSLNDYLRPEACRSRRTVGREAFARLDGDGQAAAKRILLSLAAPGEGAEVVRRRAPLAEFDLDRDADASRAMAVFTDARLVTVAEGTAEVAHEALLHEWPRLRTWLEDDAEGGSSIAISRSRRTHGTRSA
jgi:hypothetical protein